MHPAVQQSELGCTDQIGDQMDKSKSTVMPRLSLWYGTKAIDLE